MLKALEGNGCTNTLSYPTPQSSQILAFLKKVFIYF